MARLFQKTGSFAGDYSGAAGVLQEMDGMLIFCDAGACMGGFLFGEDPKNFFGIITRETDCYGN